MKRTFLARRNALLSSASLSWGGGALLFAVVAVLMRLLAPDLFWQATSPAFGFADAVASKSRFFFAGFGDAATLAARNEVLEKENAALRYENQALLEKNRSTHALGSPTGIWAGVVARPPESPYDAIVLSAGKEAGVALGQEAFGEGGVPLGAVTAVTDNFSRVTLFSAPGVITHGWVGSANTPLSLAGAGAGTVRATLSRSAKVTVGDTVFLPGPGMLPAGTVVRIDSDSASPALTLHIQMKANPFSLTWVELRDVGRAFRAAFSLGTSTAP